MGPPDQASGKRDQRRAALTGPAVPRGTERRPETFRESRSPSRRDDVGFGEQATKPVCGLLAVVAIQPADHGGHHVVIEGNAVPRDDGEQGVNRLEGVAGTDGDVDVIGVDSGQIRMGCGGEFPGHGIISGRSSRWRVTRFGHRGPIRFDNLACLRR